MKKNYGFSIMELMVVIAIIGILAAIATPNLISWLQNRKYNDSLQRTISVFNSARMRAVKENTNTIILFNTGTNNFRAFVDVDRDNTWNAAEDRLIDFFEMPHGVNLKGGEDITFDSNRTGFNGRGMPLDNQTGKVVLESDRGLSHEIEVNITGRIRLL